MGFIALTHEWNEEYNERRPHEALQNRTPTEENQQVQPNITP
jgi:transposase InsO family protein